MYPSFCYNLERHAHEDDGTHIRPHLKFENGLEVCIGRALSNEIVRNQGAFFPYIHAVSHGYHPEIKHGLTDVLPRDGKLWGEAIDLFTGGEYMTLIRRYELAPKSTIAVKVDTNGGNRNVLYGLFDLEKKRLVLIGSYRVR